MIALAADVALPDAVALYRRVAAHVPVVKVGLSLFVEHGPASVRGFTELGARVFLDLKLHDIPNTVRLAARRAGALGASYLTVHALGGEAMVRAAVEGAAEGATSAGLPPPAVLAVTVLTSTAEGDLAALGIGGSVAAQVDRLAELAHRAGAPGVVCSVREAAASRKRLGPSGVVCTPGVRPAGSAAGDQARVETPAEAVRQGASLLVVGRPIYEAADPVAAAAAIAAEVRAAR